MYCRPANALANRLMGISSCLRLARRWGYDFVLVWEHGYGSFFNAPYSDLFVSEFKVLSNVLPVDRKFRTVTKIPVPVENGRSFFAKPDHHEDILIEGWHHFCFDVEDIGKSVLLITNEIRNELLLQIRASSLTTQIYEAYGGDPRRSFDVGVHIRKGALEWTGIADVCTTSHIVRFYQALASEVSSASVYITGTSALDNAEFLIGILSSTIDARVSPAMNFEATLVNHALAIGDFFQLSRCKTVLRLARTTYSGLAALLGDCSLYTIVSSTAWSKQDPHVMSGSGL